jgi:hypothetical protein
MSSDNAISPHLSTLSRTASNGCTDLERRLTGLLINPAVLFMHPFQIAVLNRL